MTDKAVEAAATAVYDALRNDESLARAAVYAARPIILTQVAEMLESEARRVEGNRYVDPARLLGSIASYLRNPQAWFVDSDGDTL